MAILSTCCCWSTVRKGCFASGIYSMIYFSLLSAVTSSLLHDELLFFSNATAIKPDSLIDPATTSLTSMVFSGILLTFSTLGILTSILLLYGVYRDQRFLLIPWILAVVGFIIVDVVHCLYTLVIHAIRINPSTSILFTMDFFLHSLNVYALLCVISQYQELKCGRGRAEDELHNGIPSIRYSTQPTATTYLSTKRAMAYTEAPPSPSQSPTGTGPHTSLGTDEPSPNSVNRGPRKSVKFNPTPNGSHTLDIWSMDQMLLARNSVSEN